MTPPLKSFPRISWPDMEQISRQGCQCCQKQGKKHQHFSARRLPELTARCHQGPVYVAYWQDWLYIMCGECRRAIGKIKVDKSLL